MHTFMAIRPQYMYKQSKYLLVTVSALAAHQTDATPDRQCRTFWHTCGAREMLTTGMGDKPIHSFRLQALTSKDTIEQNMN